MATTTTSFPIEGERAPAEHRRAYIPSSITSSDGGGRASPTGERTSMEPQSMRGINTPPLSSLLEELLAMHPVRTVYWYQVVCEWNCMNGQPGMFGDNTHIVLGNFSTLEEATIAVFGAARDMPNTVEWERKIHKPTGLPWLIGVRSYGSLSAEGEGKEEKDIVYVSIRNVHTVTRAAEQVDYLCIVKCANKGSMNDPRVEIIGPFKKMDEANTRAASEWEMTYRSIHKKNSTSSSGRYNAAGLFHGNVTLVCGSFMDFTVVKRNY